jgi:hypothetical protein
VNAGGELHARRVAMKTISRPGRPGAPLVASTANPASASESKVASLPRKRSVESDVSTAPSDAKT